MGVVYKITNTETGRVYIGQTIKSLSARWSCHKAAARMGRTNLLCQDLRLYNYDTSKLVMEVLEGTDSLVEREAYWIAYYKNIGPVYNMTDGPPSFTKESREKQQESIKNYKWSAERRARQSEMNKGRVVSEDTKIKLRKKQTPEFIKKRVDAKTTRSRAIYQFDLNGNIVASYPGLFSLESTPFGKATVCKVLHNGAKTYKGFIWSYEPTITKDKIISSKTRSKPQSKEIIRIDPVTGATIKYVSVADAARINRSSSGNISRAVKNNGICVGYKWTYNIERQYGS